MPVRKCKHCGKKNNPQDGVLINLKFFCDYSCAAKFGKVESVKIKQKENKARLKELQPASYWIKKAQSAVNKYVRIRDKNKPCISCGRFHQGQYHAGHYRTTKAMPELRFNTFNIYKQCQPCNNHLSGNIPEYRLSLIRLKGAEFVDWLEGYHESKRYSIEHLKRIAKIFNAKSRIYERRFR